MSDFITNEMYQSEALRQDIDDKFLEIRRLEEKVKELEFKILQMQGEIDNLTPETIEAKLKLIRPRTHRYQNR